VREGVSVRAASRETGVSPSTVYRLVAGFRATLSRHALAASTLRRRA
jgi:transposase